MTWSLLRVAILGPESCGKSTLALALEARLRHAALSVARVDEYARDYYAERVYQPEIDDVLAIARGQLQAESRSSRSRPQVMLCDSTVLTCVIWAEVAFGAAPRPLLELNRPQDYDLTLLACPDIPWVPDPLRSHEYERDPLLQRYRAALARFGAPWVEIRGQGDLRAQCAWQALQQKLQ